MKMLLQKRFVKQVPPTKQSYPEKNISGKFNWRWFGFYGNFLTYKTSKTNVHMRNPVTDVRRSGNNSNNEKLGGKLTHAQ